jgi:Sigma-70, region 4
LFLRKWERRWSTELPGPTPIPEPWVDPDLVAAIRTLPQGQREVITLVALGELTPTEAARVLGKPAGTVRSLLFQARVALHQALDEATAPEEEDDLGDVRPRRPGHPTSPAGLRTRGAGHRAGRHHAMCQPSIKPGNLRRATMRRYIMT